MTKDQRSVQEQLSEVRAQRDKLTAERTKREEDKKLAAELEQEKQALTDEQALSELEGKYPASRIRAVQTDMGLVVLQRPRAPEYQRFVDKGDASYASANSFVAPCVLYPTAQKLHSMLDEMPGILPGLLNNVIELAGVKLKEREGK
jgi:hypothetical protein